MKRLALWSIAFAITLSLSGLPAAAQSCGPATVRFDPTPSNPNGGDECDIVFRGDDVPGCGARLAVFINTFVAFVDLAKAYGSEAAPLDLIVKLKEACNRTSSKQLIISLQYNTPKLRVAGEATLLGPPPTPIVFLDLYDIDAIVPKHIMPMEDSPARRKALATFVWRALFHEIDHARDPAKRKDPTKGAVGDTGPAVDDANTVLQDLGLNTFRNEYAYSKNGETVFDLDSCGQVFEVKLGRILIESGGRQKGRRNFGEFVPGLGEIPAKPCSGNPGEVCFPAAGVFDIDLDGVVDGLDNCPNDVNPQQLDTDEDGAGAACEADDDADDVDDALELGLGAARHVNGSLPEHWACRHGREGCAASANPCSDGIDNDGDGIVDGDDPSCLGTAWYPELFPSAPAPGSPSRRRGGTAPLRDGLGITLNLPLGIDEFDGPDEFVLASGPLAVLRAEPETLSRGGVRSVPFERLSLAVSDAGIAIGHSEALPSTGRLTALSPASDFPAVVTFDLFLEFELPGSGTLVHNEVPLTLEATVFGWPPYEMTLDQLPGVVPFLDDASDPVASVEFSNLDVDLPDFDFDDFSDPEDNCPAVPNPGQEDADFDGIGDVCDSCPADFDDLGRDDDLDGIGDVCDPQVCGNGAFEIDEECDDGNFTNGDGCNFFCQREDIDDDGVYDDGDESGSAGDTPCVSGMSVDCDDNCPGAVNPDQIDSDGDGHGDVCDNCGAVPNPTQIDTDGDSLGDACDDDDDGDGLSDAEDNCATDHNVDQSDTDRDGAGDACDNCALATNASQDDVDDDGTGDRCDLSDGVLLFEIDATAAIRWQDETVFDSFNLYRGDLAILAAGGSYTQPPGSNPLAAAFCSLSNSVQPDATVPAPGQIAFYLVTGNSAMGEGSLGDDGSGNERPATAPCNSSRSERGHAR